MSSEEREIMAEKDMTIAEALELASVRIQENKLSNALNIYAAILEAVPNHEAARIGHLAVSDAIDCEYAPPLTAENIKNVIRLSAEERQDTVLMELKKLLDLFPRSAFVLNALAVANRNIGDLQQTCFILEKALKISPANSDVFLNLLNALYEYKQFQRGLKIANTQRIFALDAQPILYFKTLFAAELSNFDTSKESALAVSEKYPSEASSWSARGIFELKFNLIFEAITSLENYFELGGNEAEINHNLGVLYAQSSQYKRAKEQFEIALKKQPKSADFHHSYGLCLLALGDLENGFLEYEWRFQRKNDFFIPLNAAEKWTGQKEINGKTILVYHEQGLGDSLQFLRYLYPLKEKGAKILLCVQSTLIPLLEDTQLPVKLVSTKNDDLRTEYSVSLISLGACFAREFSQNPPKPAKLSVSAETEKYWYDKLSGYSLKVDRPKVGLCWRGSPSHKNNHNRSMELPVLRELFDLPIQFVNLQLDPTEEENQIIDACKIINPMPLVKNFKDTAGIIRNLDCVITVDTSIAHLSNNLNIKTMILLSVSSDWRWGENSTESFWYPEAELVHQKNLGDWSQPIDQLKSNLAKYFDFSNT